MLKSQITRYIEYRNIITIIIIILFFFFYSHLFTYTKLNSVLYCGVFFFFNNLFTIFFLVFIFGGFFIQKNASET